MSNKSIFDITESEQTPKEFKPAPSKLETNFGTLEFTGGGFPTPETTQKLFDELDLQRANQAYLEFYPALSLMAMLKGQVQNYGVRSCSDLLVFGNKMNTPGDQ